MRTRAIRLYSPLILSVAILVFLAGCGSSSTSSSNPNNPPLPGATNPPSGGSGGSGGSNGGGAAAANTYVYALDQVVQQIAAYKLDESTGVLNPVAGMPFPVTQRAITMTATPSTAYLYVFDWMAKQIVIYRADPSTGALTQTGTLSVPNFDWGYLLASPNNKFVFMAGYGFSAGNHVDAFAIGSGGALTPAASVKVDQPPHFASLDAQTHLLYVSADANIYGFTVGSNGSLTAVPGSPVAVRAPYVNPDKGPTGIAAYVDPGAHYVFVSDATSTNTYVYAVGSNGALTQVPGSPFNTPGSRGVITTDPAGKFLFEGGYNIVASSIIESGGLLSPAPGSPFDNGPFLSGGAPVAALATDPQGKFLLTANAEESSITVFSINGSNGALTNVSGSPFNVPGHPLGGGSPLTIVITH